MLTTANWNYPTAMRFGAGRAKETPAACEELGIRRPLVVTDPGIAALPLCTKLLNTLRQHGLAPGLFADIKANPNGENVAAGTDAMRAGNHDGVIALGGGSALDAGKAIALMAGQSCGLFDLEDIDDNWQRADASAIAPVIAIPTTAGTGSEVGRASVITDTAAEVKRIIFHPGMVPAIVIADPELTVGLPARLTAATGMDALSHNLEAFCAPGYHPMARGIAVEGIRMIKQWLPKAVADGTDLEARGHMLVASSMGATAFQRGLGAMHALAHPLGALYDAHHGTLNAVLMPYVLIANLSAIRGELAYLSRCLELNEASTSAPNIRGAHAIIDWVLSLRAEVGIPQTLANLGIDDAQADRIADMAVADPSAGTNPIRFDAAQYRAIFVNAVRGQL